MRRTSVVATACLAVALLAASGLSALADVIHLSAGGVLRGEIVSETKDEVQIKTPGGLVTVHKDDVEKIERGGSPKEMFAERKKALKAGDVKGLLALAVWAKGLRLEAEAREAYEAVLKVDPSNQDARMGLGHALRNGQWMTGEEAAKLDAQLFAGLAKDDAAEVEASLAEAAGPKTAAPLEKRVRDLLKAAASPDEAKRKEALAALTAFPEAEADGAITGEGGPTTREEATAHLREVIAAAAKQVERAKRKRVEDVEKALAKTLSYLDRKDAKKHLEARAKALGAWEDARRAALDVIFDLKIYPDENHGKVGQPIVDEKVAVVRERYTPYEAALLDDLRPFLGMDETEAKALVARRDADRAAATGLGALIAALGKPAADPLPTTHPAREALLLYRAGELKRAYALKGSLSAYEVRLFERLRDTRVEDYNERMLNDTKVLDAGDRPIRPEREQVRITNDYRRLMGRESLEIHPCLVKCARGHSADMTRLGFFAHESPIAEKREPSMRAKLAGYPSGVAENISLGSVAPQATHDAWYNSSGHHRNILGTDHQALGAGLDGQHWTQNFGSVGLCER